MVLSVPIGTKKCLLVGRCLPRSVAAHACDTHPPIRRDRRRHAGERVRHRRRRTASSSSTAPSPCPAAARCAPASRRSASRCAACSSPTRTLTTTAARSSCGLDVPIFATAGVDDVIRRDDPVKEQILRPMFGDEWPRERAFPNRVVADGERLSLGGIELTVPDLGPGRVAARQRLVARRRSPHGVLRRPVLQPHARLPGRRLPRAVAGATSRGCAASCRAGATLHPGHGEPAGLELLDWQERLHPHASSMPCAAPTGPIRERAHGVSDRGAVSRSCPPTSCAS